ncbi:farnesyl pyrophosphate synthase 1-like isoform X1 [Ananas comosus]|uniref:Farnesyl pyrophosphate synthase 1-like isoform X1 n=1 Tax=Ananas comosus TaxID=4615 RepID=A0A6P5EJC3_ANACO|nr:farnesyl pyrophosphate synthase 1-like isoform X1 [Ananas comosus]
MARDGETRSRFLRVYDCLKDELLRDPLFDHTEETRRRVEEMLDYNVPRGKLNRGLAIVETYRLLKEGDELSEEEIFLACVLGWCNEWLQACLLILDDIMDNSHTRRGQLCWYKLPEVGLHAINDGVLIKCHIHRIIKRYFRGKPFYENLMELCDEVGLQTSLGQMLDLIVTHEGEKDLSNYTMAVYRRIVQYKTSYYSFYLPVACALLLAGENLDDFIDVKNILVEMGIYFQVQDDYLDCFGDPKVMGKIGTDIEDYKCSWLVVQALERANDNQRRVLYENYGKSDSVSVAKVKNIYEELNLQDVFFKYGLASYEHLISSIEAQPNAAVREVLEWFLRKIHCRQK